MKAKEMTKIVKAKDLQPGDTVHKTLGHVLLRRTVRSVTRLEADPTAIRVAYTDHTTMLCDDNHTVTTV
jgi:hypothetical protein